MSTHTSLEELAARIGALLHARGEVLATVESCTGGWVAAAVTSVPGSSAWFDRGFVTYSNRAKQELVDVPAQTLAEHGAVSEATARAMALGGLARSGASVAVAVTGVAGPQGGSPDKPVGTVCFAWARRGGETRVERLHFDGDREAVRRQSVAHALAGVKALLESAGGARA